MKMCPKSKLTILTRRKTFVLNVFRFEAILWDKTLTHYIRHLPKHVWSPASYFASSQGCIQIALTFAYKLGLRRFLYQNRPIRRDEDNSCRSFLHPRLS